MRKVSRSALVPYSGTQMFALVEDVDAYPEFLPFCQSTEVHRREGDTLEASLEIGRGPAAMRFTTRNTLEPGRKMEIRLLDGPFRELRGTWRFDPVDAGACRVTLEMEFEFASAALATLFSATFEQTVGSMVDAFTKRARAVYGRH